MQRIPTYGSRFDKLNAKDGLNNEARIKLLRDAGIKDKYVGWALLSYAEGGIVDLYKVDELYEWLSIFDKLVKHKMLSSVDLDGYTFNEKDINSYCGLDGCRIKYDRPGLKTWLSLNHKDDIEKLKEIARKKYAGNEVDKVFETDNILIIRPNTEEASCKYGAGTKWCTAASEDNRFYEYTEEGDPLYILIDKSGSEKYQLHFGTRQYTRADNSEIGLGEIINLYPDVMTWFYQPIGNNPLSRFNEHSLVRIIFEDLYGKYETKYGEEVSPNLPIGLGKYLIKIFGIKRASIEDVFNEIMSSSDLEDLDLLKTFLIELYGISDEDFIKFVGRKIKELSLYLQDPAAINFILDIISKYNLTANDIPGGKIKTKGFLIPPHYDLSIFNQVNTERLKSLNEIYELENNEVSTLFSATNDLASIKWVTNNFNVTRDDIISRFITASKNNNLFFMKWLHENYKITPAEARTANNEAFRYAFVLGFSDIVDWLRVTFGIKNTETYPVISR